MNTRILAFFQEFDQTDWQCRKQFEKTLFLIKKSIIGSQSKTYTQKPFLNKKKNSIYWRTSLEVAKYDPTHQPIPSRSTYDPHNPSRVNVFWPMDKLVRLSLTCLTSMAHLNFPLNFNYYSKSQRGKHPNDTHFLLHPPLSTRNSYSILSILLFWYVLLIKKFIWFKLVLLFNFYSCFFFFF